MSSGKRWTVGLSAVLVAAAALVPQLVPSLNLRTGVAVGIVAAAALVGLLVTLVTEHASDRAADRALHAKLDAALGCWPPRPAADLSPYELGAHPTGDAPPANVDGAQPPYVRRGFDDALDAALGGADPVLLYGPARAGKTRSAYEALARGHGSAKLLAPEDADGLRTVLAHLDELFANVAEPSKDRRQATLVLWLDDLERFLPGLDLDVLDRLGDDMRSRLRVRLDALRRRRHTRRRVTLVATVGEAALAALLDEDAAEPHPGRHRARRLLGRSRAIHVPEPTPAELSAAHDGPLASLPGRLQDGWSATPGSAYVTERERGGPSPMIALVGAALALALGLTPWYGFSRGWEKPRSTAEQLAALKRKPPACAQRRASPSAADEVDERTVVVMAVDRRGCGESDQLVLHQLRYGVLKRFDTLTLAGEGPQRAFACIGATASDPCAVRTEHGERILVGAFDDPRSYQQIPFALQPDGDDELHLVSLSPAPPASSPTLDRATLRADRRAQTLHLDGDRHDAAGGCEPEEEACVTSHGAQAWAAFSQVDGLTVLVAGYLAKGSAPESPRLLRMRAWRLLSKQGTPVVAQRCWVYASGVRARHVATTASAATATDDLAIAWRRLSTRSGSSVVC